MNTTDVVRRFFAEVVTAGKVELIDELVAPDFSGLFPISPEPLTGPDGYRMVVGAFRSAFPDLATDVADLVADGDRVAVLVRASGTHEGELMGIAPTHQSVSWPVVHLMRVRDGQIVGDRVIFDRLDLLTQLGAA